MDHLVKFLLGALVGWINRNPDTPFSRFMLKQRGPRTDVKAMNRLERLKSALVFFLWGVVFALLWMGFAYVMFGLKLAGEEENPAIMIILASLAIFAGIGLVSGLYLLIRVIA